MKILVGDRYNAKEVTTQKQFKEELVKEYNTVTKIIEDSVKDMGPRWTDNLVFNQFSIEVQCENIDVFGEKDSDVRRYTCCYNSDGAECAFEEELNKIKLAEVKAFLKEKKNCSKALVNVCGTYTMEPTPLPEPVEAFEPKKPSLLSRFFGWIDPLLVLVFFLSIFSYGVGSYMCGRTHLDKDDTQVTLATPTRIVNNHSVTYLPYTPVVENADSGLIRLENGCIISAPSIKYISKVEVNNPVNKEDLKNGAYFFEICYYDKKAYMFCDDDTKRLNELRDEMVSIWSNWVKQSCDVFLTPDGRKTQYHK